MCDTFVVLPKATGDQSLIFAKNSDRSPNEPHIVVSFPACDYDPAKRTMVKLTYLTIPQAEHTYAVTLLKPSWIWGAEMGFNEHGVNIGNEAVFTRLKRNGPDALTGMDLLRLALERASTAKGALHVILDLLGQYGQGGNCGYDHRFYYHNSFLIADKYCAYVLETAGKFYAVKIVEDYAAISNRLSIGTDYSYIHPEAEIYARTKGYIKKGEKFDFAKAFSDQMYTFFAKGKERRSSVMDALQRLSGKITVSDAIDILRSHSAGKRENGASVGSVCMHAGGIIGDQTTGSYVARLTETISEYYITASSLPCLSMFKPFLPGVAMPSVIQNETESLRYWYQAEKLHRYLLSGQADKSAYLLDKEAFEKKYIQEFRTAKTSEEKESIMVSAWAESEKLIDKHLRRMDGQPYVFSLGNPFYRRYWKKKTSTMLSESQKV
jgi:dipeptidase